MLKVKDFWLNPPSLSHWTSSSDPCTWSEITCTNNSITSITVASQNINQTIPPFICDLKNLAVLDLTDNVIPGNFPTSLYNCSKLQYLDLSENYFIGVLPDDIHHLSPQLEFLNLGGNNFTGDIPAAIGEISGLKELRLFGNLFNGSFPQEIGQLSNLEVLNLNENGFVPQTIPTSFTGLKKLTTLWMFGTNLIGQIPQDIGNLTALEYLDLSRNSLNGSIPPGLFLLKNLSILYLYKNQLSGIIPQVVEALNLDVLDLSYNNLTGSIPDGFGKLNKLTGLALFQNELSGQVPASIGSLPGLINVGLYSNNLSGELPPDFGRYSMLEKFQVALNNFSGKLPEYLCANGVLMGLIAFSSNLSGGLPESLANCSTLQYVQLYDNRLSGQIPEGLWSSNNLTWLMISDNLFNGPLPGNSGFNLSILDISNNQFSGEVPTGLSNSVNLRVLKASNNLFNGSFPQELTSLPEVNTLELGGNSLSGDLPKNIVSWKSLNTLDLKGNQLSGQIPAALAYLPVLSDLDLSENALSGEIPPDFGRKRLTVFNVSSNHLTGRLPTAFENAAFNRSFLNNPGLCMSSSSLGLRNCLQPQTRNQNKQLSRSFIAIITSIAAVAFLVAFIYCYLLIRNYRKKDKVISTWKLTSFQKLNFTESTILSSLTENNVIGSGGSGKVYRVPVNHSGGCVAVKRINNDQFMDQRLEKQFLAEVEILGTIRHFNIVKLMCCLSAENSKLLVYEYMENRSLDLWLHQKRKPSVMSGSVHHVVLDWQTRLQIAISAARGLCYMHHECPTPIIHRDMKTSNILLNSEFNAKIADFGLSRILHKDGVSNTMSVVAGSFGYIAPEYAQSSKVSEKIDVFSFGVILLELVTGKEANYGDENSSLADWARRLVQEEKVIEDVIDDDIKEPSYLVDIIQVFKLAIYCTNVTPWKRPTMKEVLQVLQSFQPLKVIKKHARSEQDESPLLKGLQERKNIGFLGW